MFEIFYSLEEELVCGKVFDLVRKFVLGGEVVLVEFLMVEKNLSGFLCLGFFVLDF